MKNIKLLAITIALLFLNFTFLGISRNTQQKEYYNIHKSIYNIDSTAIKLKSVIDNILEKNSNILKKTNYGIAILDLAEAKYIYGRNVELPLTPASTTKLYTTFYAMATQPTVRTSIYHDGMLINGVLKGNMYLFGRGDALLNSNDLDLLAQEIANKGIKKIEGNFIIDDSFFDKLSNRSIYSGDYEVVQPLPEIKPFILNKNSLALHISSSANQGDKVNVSMDPASDRFAANVSATVKPTVVKKQLRKKARGRNLAAKGKSGKKGRKSRASSENLGDYETRVVSAPTGIKVSSVIDPSGKQVFNVVGSLAPNRRISQYYVIKKPEFAIAGAILTGLRKRGVEINGTTMLGRLPISGYNVLAEVKRPTQDIAKIINKFSDNYVAEHLFKFNGANSNKINNAEGARLSLSKFCDSLQIPFANCRLNDGSGLSRRNLVTPSSEIRLLQIAHSNQQLKFDSTLAIAGVDGTLRNRMIGTKAQANLHGKTGTLRNVSALSGYVTSPEGNKIAFTFIFNGPNVGAYKQLENQIGIALANFNYEK